MKVIQSLAKAEVLFKPFDPILKCLPYAHGTRTTTH